MNSSAGPLGQAALLRLLLCAFLCVTGLCLTSSADAAQARRAALIIGNAGYVNSQPLPNPVNDAQIVAGAAQRAGFEVTLLTNLDKASFDNALRQFRQSADGAEVAMVYYAGHGIESGGRNWLLPVDVHLNESRDLRFEALELDGLLETLAGSQLRIVILDACRNNPFGNNWQSGTRSVNKGLAETEIEGALVIYSAAGGQVASDGAGGNSPFALSLANRLAEPGLSIHRLGSAILDDVMSATGGQQRPWTNMSIASREFFLVDQPRAATAGPAQAAATAQAIPSADRSTMDALMWQGADAADTADGYNAYLRAFPEGLFANMSRTRLARLQGADPAPAPSGAPASPVAPSRAPVAYAAPPPEPTAPQPAATSFVAPMPARPSAAPLSGAGRLVVMQTAKDAAPLPLMPATPRFPGDGYPSCRESFQSVTDPIGKVTAINGCIAAMTSYFETVLNGFSKSMIAHQEAISALYSDRVGGQQVYSPESQNAFYAAMMQEHAASNPGGAHFAEHAAARKRYEEDAAYLKDRYCFHTGSCGGYPVPQGVAPPPAK